jgi:DNA-binding NarL/FixJ family response regulator
VRGVRALWRGDVDRAQSLLTRLLQRALDQDEEFGQVVFLVHLFELDLRIGDAHRLARRVTELTDALAPFPDVAPAMIGRARAALAAARGDVDASLTALDHVRSIAHGSAGWHALEARRLVGVAALNDGDAERAVEQFSAVWEHLERAGIREPGAFPVAPDLIEALVAVGRVDDAARVLEQFAQEADRLAHPWGRATAARARGQVLLARDDLAPAEASLLRALSLHAELQLPRDAARTRLALGVVHRRARRRREARSELEAARDAFVELGATARAARAADELARVAGRRSATGLTPTEQRVAALVADGLTNKQIAERLVVSVAAVEAHLTRIYAKLGVRRRTELAVKVLGSPD